MNIQWILILEYHTNIYIYIFIFFCTIFVQKNIEYNYKIYGYNKI